MRCGASTHSDGWRWGVRLLMCLALVGAACGDSQHFEQGRGGSDPLPLGGGHTGVQKESEAKPGTPLNLLLVTLDTTRADALGAYGQRWPVSPRIDELASRGVLFEQVATSNPETLPAHSTIFTGRWPFLHGVRSNGGYVLPQSERTLAEILREHGYETAAEVAAPVLRRATQVTQGFQHYRGAESDGVVLKKIRFTDMDRRTVTKPMRVGSDISAKAIAFLRHYRSKKFFLWLHYFDAHDPYFAPPAFNRKIPQSTYHAEVASADFEFGLVLDEIDRLGLRDRTLVVVTADHGEGLGEHDEPSHSYFVYETTMRVPLIVAGPRSLPAGKRVGSLVRSVDILPTALDLLGLPIPGRLSGVSLRPLIDGRSDDLHLGGYGEATRFVSVFGLSPLRSLRQGRWKYIHKVGPELYDLAADPRERHNRAGERPDVVERLRAALRALLGEAADASAARRDVIDPRTAAELAALGYSDRSPAPQLSDRFDSLELAGQDPRGKIGDTLPISIALGLLERGAYAEALDQLRPVQMHNPKSAYVLELVANALLGLEQGEQAAKTLHALLELEPCDARSRDRLAQLLRQKADYAALRELLSAGSSRCPDSLAELNNYAWALATLPDPTLRDGHLAEKLIRQAIARTGGSEPAHLDTLAAALAEQGRFDEAIATESQLLQELERNGAPAEVRDEVHRHLDRFHAKKAVRDPAEPDH